MPNKIVFVCGSPGAGKSSVIGGIIANRNYTVVNVGNRMEEAAINKGYARDRDDIRFMSKEHFDELQVSVFKKISEMEGNIVLDTHATVEQNGRYLPGITFGKSGHLKSLVAFVYIDALTVDIETRERMTRREEGRMRGLSLLMSKGR